MTATAAGSGNVWNPLPLPTGSPVVPQLPGNLPPALPTNGLGIGAIQNFGPLESRWQPTTGVVGVTGYSYQWGAVEWFLIPQTNPNAGNQQDMTVTDPETGSAPVPLYTLYRRQALLVPDNNLVNLATLTTGFAATRRRPWSSYP